MSEETWEQKHARQCAESTAKAMKVWEKSYKSRKPDKKEPFGYGTEFIFNEGSVANDKLVGIKTTSFRFMKDGNVYMSKRINKDQRFAVVNGPKAGKRLTTDEAGEGYVRFNLAYRSRELPSAVLVHKASIR